MNYRLNRLFNAKSNRCFDVAIDHGFFNERSFLQGIENLDKAVRMGVTREEVAEAITHLAFYLGWPAALSAHIPGT